MGYVVSHRDATDVVRLDDVESLDQAVAWVERLRNEDGPTDVRVFREVPFEVRTYFKVVVAEETGSTADAPAVPAADAPPPSEAAPPVDAPPADAPIDATTDGAPPADAAASTVPVPGDPPAVPAASRTDTNPFAPLLEPPTEPAVPAPLTLSAVTPPPGAMPMTPLSPVSPTPVAEDPGTDEGTDEAAPPLRRASRFSRGG